ncbi:MAG: FlgD immunoglobulin-like domain containing protein, partial [Bacteroidota bacterium]
ISQLISTIWTYSNDCDLSSLVEVPVDILDPIVKDISFLKLPNQTLEEFIDRFVIELDSNLILTNTKEPDLGINIEVTPNPFSEQVYISFELPSRFGINKIYISIFDTYGKKVVSSSLKTSINFGKVQWVWDGRDSNGNQLPAGIYLLALQSEKGMKTMKLSLARY